MSIGRSVSLYSLQEPYFLGKMDLEACVAAVKNQVGADGIEVLVDQMPYPSLRSEDRTMSDDDIAKFKDLMQKYQTVPTAYDTTFFTTWYAKRNMSNRETIYWTKRYGKLRQNGLPGISYRYYEKKTFRFFLNALNLRSNLAFLLLRRFIHREVFIPGGHRIFWKR